MSIGADFSSTDTLLSNSNISYRGIIFVGSGFIVSENDVLRFRNNKTAWIKYVHEIRNARDITTKPRLAHVIDVSHFELENLKVEHPDLFQRLQIDVFDDRRAKRGRTP